MRKEVESTEEAFFCDVCGKQINDANWAYGGHASASEETKECIVCRRDTCPNCRDTILTIEDYQEHNRIVCTECLANNKDNLERIVENWRIYGEQGRALKKQYLAVEKNILKQLKPQKMDSKCQEEK